MSVIPNGGGYTWSLSYVGLAREIVIDTDNQDLLIHDGVTEGGFRVLNRDNADERYMVKIPDLLGFAAFNAVDKGIPFRLGLASYRLGKLTVNENNLTIDNPDGSTGDPLFSLAPVIDSAHTVSVAWTFAAGIIGNVTGNLTGNSAGTHTGPVVGNVTGNAAGNHTGSFTGDVDVRGETIQFDNGQIPQAAVAGLVAALANAAMPSGAIIMWSGIVADIPAGFLLCDGTNGTPDLSGKFVRSQGPGVAPHSSGGANTHTHTATAAANGVHSHGITVSGHALTIPEMPAHNHGNGVTDATTNLLFNHGAVAASPTTADSIENNGSDGIYEGLTTTVGTGAAHSHGATSDSAGSHAHALTVDAASTLPAYYALCFIMKG